MITTEKEPFVQSRAALQLDGKTATGVQVGEFKVPVSAEVRDRAGVPAGDELEVTIELDDAPRELTIPAETPETRDRRIAKVLSELA